MKNTIKINTLAGMIKDKYGDKIECEVRQTCIHYSSGHYDLNIIVDNKETGSGYQVLSPRDVDDIKIGISLELAESYINPIGRLLQI